MRLLQEVAAIARLVGGAELLARQVHELVLLKVLCALPENRGLLA